MLEGKIAITVILTQINNVFLSYNICDVKNVIHWSLVTQTKTEFKNLIQNSIYFFKLVANQKTK